MNDMLKLMAALLQENVDTKLTEGVLRDLAHRCRVFATQCDNRAEMIRLGLDKGDEG